MLLQFWCDLAGWLGYGRFKLLDLRNGHKCRRVGMGRVALERLRSSDAGGNQATGDEMSWA